MAQVRVVVVGHHVHIVGLGLLYVRGLHDRHQVCPVLGVGERGELENCGITLLYHGIVSYIVGVIL